MKQIMMPQVGGTHFEVFKDLNGGVVLRINSESVKLPPRSAYDLAVVLLKQIGAEVNELPKRADDLGGNPLKAKLKII